MEGQALKLGKRLKDKRIAEATSLRDLELIIGVSFSTLARIERGTGSCTADTSKRVLDWIETGKGTAKRLRRPKSWHITTEQRLAKIEAHLWPTDDGLLRDRHGNIIPTEHDET